MRVVDAAERPPQKCAVTGKEQGPFVNFLTQIDPGNPSIPNNLYLRAATVEEAAALLGMVPKSELDQVVEQLAKVTDELAEAREDMRVLGEFEERFKERSAA